MSTSTQHKIKMVRYVVRYHKYLNTTSNIFYYTLGEKVKVKYSFLDANSETKSELRRE